MLRIILGILAGVAVAMVLVICLELAGHAVFPPPAGLDPLDKADQARLIAMMPLGAALTVVNAWLLGSWGGAAVAGLISRRMWPGWVIAALIACGGLYTVLTIPHPLWMQVAAVAAPLIGGWLAMFFGRRITAR
ncbi:hypothetical protein [Brevundimonas lenta]|uniref:Uncharacterized protein n=1 Tax=Brevundimonas lenta TaxID=424796 RepID=A0A7W6JB95_9CAUL|nr:hypothetical protein [Brevundimonas lenta]MBB4081939.1 hypothetical protein [Brevundimonas lenta]